MRVSKVNSSGSGASEGLESLEMACVKAERIDKKVLSFVYRSSPVVQNNQDGKSEFQRVASMQGVKLK